jgi:hypothetical protein
MNKEKALSKKEILPDKTLSQNQMLSQNMLESFLAQIKYLPSELSLFGFQ